MGINKAMRLVLKALSYPELDIKKRYKLQRSLKNMKSPHILKPVYRKWDHRVYCGDREITLRIYTPREIRYDFAMLFIHGGGWVTESIDTYHRVCSNLADHICCSVVSVEYRLAPEFPFPNGLEDCYAAAQALHQHADAFGVRPRDLVLIGDSAGANLAAAVSLMARDRGVFCISKQILIYPATYHDHTAHSPFPSVRENGTDYLLTSKRICDYMELYKSSPEDLQNPYFAPLLAGNLSEQPDTLLITAEYDPLRDEGEAYGEALKNAGNRVTIYRMGDALHGFFSLPPHFVHVRRTYALIRAFLYPDMREEETV